MASMAFMIKWVTPTGPGSFSAETAFDAVATAKAAQIAGELISITDANGVDLSIETLELLASAEGDDA